MRIKIINYLVCPLCGGDFSLLIHKKIKERVFDGELKCKKCSKKFRIKDGTACFINLKRQERVDKQKLRRITIKQELPKTWTRFFSKKELAALRREWKWILATVKKKKNAVHLDLATGTGRFIRELIPKTKGEIVTLDFSYSACEELVHFLKKINKYDRASVVCADARQMPFKDKVFDGVTSWHGLDEPRMEKAIAEARRVLKDGGYFAASGIHYKNGSKSFSLAKKYHIYLITKDAIVGALEKAGFRKIEHKTLFSGKWNEAGSYLPVLGDFYSTYVVRARK